MAGAKFTMNRSRSNDLSPLLGEALSGSDRHHVTNNTMLHKCLLRAIDGGVKLTGQGQYLGWPLFWVSSSPAWSIDQCL